MPTSSAINTRISAIVVALVTMAAETADMKARVDKIRIIAISPGHRFSRR